MSLEFFITYGFGAAQFARNVKEEKILSGDNVRDAVTVVGYRAKSAACGYAIWIFLQVQSRSLAVGSLRR